MFVEPSVALIFGGCCSNVFALEAIVKHEPGSGLLITVTQLLLTALISLPSQLERLQPPPSIGKKGYHSSDEQTAADFSVLRQRVFPFRVKSPLIPFTNLAIMAFLFCAVNMLNNWAFAFDISVPMHIILRSFGSVTTLTVGWLFGKRYSRWQVASVVGLTVGVVVSAWADAAAKGTSMSLSKGSEAGKKSSSYASGLAVLLIAQVGGALQGIYTEKTYEKHGRHWLETMFYSHFLGILFSLAFLPALRVQLSRLLAGPAFTTPSYLVSQFSSYLPKLPLPLRHTLESLYLPKFPLLALIQRISPWSGAPPSKAFLLLLLNAATQVLCISGVNRLAARTTAVTVTVVLNIRKLASFLLSCWIFGNELSGLMVIGATIVFASGAVYGWDSSRQSKKRKAKPFEEPASSANVAATEFEAIDAKHELKARGREEDTTSARPRRRMAGKEAADQEVDGEAKSSNTNGSARGHGQKDNESASTANGGFEIIAARVSSRTRKARND